MVDKEWGGQIRLAGRSSVNKPREGQAETLLHELTTSQAKPPSPPADAMLDWRERPQDDLVLSIAIAAWLSERLRQFWVSLPVELAPGPAKVSRW